MLLIFSMDKPTECELHNTSKGVEPGNLASSRPEFCRVGWILPGSLRMRKRSWNFGTPKNNDGKIGGVCGCFHGLVWKDLKSWG